MHEIPLSPGEPLWRTIVPIEYSEYPYLLPPLGCKDDYWQLGEIGESW